MANEELKHTSETLIPQIGQSLVNVLPATFKESWLSMEASEDVWGAEVFFKDGLGKIRYLNEGLEGLEAQLLDLRKAYVKAGEKPWTTSTFHLTGTGHFNIAFGYEDISDFGAASQRREAWIKKHIGDKVEIAWK